jgi:hypothetical protein
VNFNDYIIYLDTEDQIHAIVDSGKPVISFLYLPGELFSEIMHPGFHAAAIDFSE